MKYQTINLVKFKALGKRLGLPMYQCVGLLESLWLLAQIQARDGDLSKFSNLEIAGWIEWPGDESALVDALVETHWLDRKDGLLAIHDWDEHKPTWLKGVEARGKGKVCEKNKPSSKLSTEPSSKLSSIHSVEPPNLTKTSKNTGHSSSEALPPEIKDLIPTNWHETTAEPLQFSDADGTEASVFEKISRVETLSDPSAIHNWWRYQLGCRYPVLGNQAVWCVVALALGLRFSNSKTQRWKSRVGIWSSALQKGSWMQAKPYIPKALKLLEPIIFPKEKSGEETHRPRVAAAAN
jgi:hypothetical protein